MADAEVVDANVVGVCARATVDRFATSIGDGAAFGVGGAGGGGACAGVTLADFIVGAGAACGGVSARVGDRTALLSGGAGGCRAFTDALGAAGAIVGAADGCTTIDLHGSATCVGEHVCAAREAVGFAQDLCGWWRACGALVGGFIACLATCARAAVYVCAVVSAAICGTDGAAVCALLNAQSLVRLRGADACVLVRAFQIRTVAVEAATRDVGLHGATIVRSGDKATRRVVAGTERFEPFRDADTCIVCVAHGIICTRGACLGALAAAVVRALYVAALRAETRAEVRSTLRNTHLISGHVRVHVTADPDAFYTRAIVLIGCTWGTFEVGQRRRVKGA